MESSEAGPGAATLCTADSTVAVEERPGRSLESTSMLLLTADTQASQASQAPGVHTLAGPEDGCRPESQPALTSLPCSEVLAALRLCSCCAWHLICLQNRWFLFFLRCSDGGWVGFHPFIEDLESN